MSDDVPPFYAMLEVDTDVDCDEITAQYRKLVKEYHPDQGGSDEEFKKLKSAKETLTSAVERRRYDRVGHKSYVEITRCSGWQESPTAGRNEGTRSNGSTRHRSDTEDASHGDRDQTANKSASEGKSSESTTNDDRKTGGRRDYSSTSSTGSQQEASHSQSTTETSRGQSSTDRGHTQSNQSTGTYTNNTQSSTAGQTNRSSWRSHSGTDDWSSIPRLLVALVFSVALSSVLGSAVGGESIVTAGIAVVVGSGVVYGRDVWIAHVSGISSGPQLPAASAALMAGVSGVGSLLLLTAFIGGSLNGGLLIGRFVGVLTLLLLIVSGVITFVVVGLLTRSAVISSIATIVVSLLLYVLEFTPLRWLFPFSAIENEPASTISPWVAAGPPTGYTLGWAVNLTLALLLFVSIVLSLSFLVFAFTHVLRDGSNPDPHTIGWELFAAVPIVGLAWWSLSGNTVWALHGLQPPSLPAALVVLTVCVWPTVVFGSYAVAARFWYT